MKNKVIKNEPVKWRECQWLQTRTFKEISDAQFERLIASMLKLDYISSLKVWQDKKGVTWILDGHHRQRALEEIERRGEKIPDMLPAEFIDCRDRKEAARYCFAYASTYAQVTEQGITDMLQEFDLDIEDLKDSIEIPGIDLDSFGIGGGGGEGAESGKDEHNSLSEMFGVPPFSVLDTRQGYWITRKRQWSALICDNAESRENVLGGLKSINTGKFGKLYKDKPNTSILDPVLAEIVCRWFCVEHGATFDPFAGSAFGYVSAYLGNSFVGVELRKEQAEINQQRVNDAGLNARYINDDGQNVANHILPGSQDLLFSCPPYFDLEKYSDLPNDASNQGSYEDFLTILRNAFTGAVSCLKDNRFAVIVIGDVRDKRGVYLDLPGGIKNIFKDLGMQLYNELILVDIIGTAMLRAAKYMGNRKVVKTHQNVFVFYKGDTRKIKKVFPALDFSKLLENSEVEDEGQDLELPDMD